MPQKPVINVDEQIEKEVEQQMRDDDAFQLRKQQSKEERIAYLNQLKREKRDMIRRQKLAEREAQQDSESDNGLYWACWSRPIQQR